MRTVSKCTCDITATMPAKTFRQLMTHPLTDKGLEGFMRDWAEVEKAGNA